MRRKLLLLWGVLVISWFKGVCGGCYSALGMQKKNGKVKIKDEQITASSQYNFKFRPALARLSSSSLEGWCPRVTDQSPYLQIDLLTPHTITKVVTQGANGNFVKKFTLTFSYDNIRWFNYTVDGTVKVFKGNRNSLRSVANNLTQPLTARLIRFHPVLNKIMAPCLRLELYGCQPSEDCDTAVGVEDRRITNQQMSASSHWNQHYASNARLNNKASYGSQLTWGGWCTDKLNKNQYLQVDLGRVRSVSGVATQGYMAEMFVSQYRMNYSTDGLTWRSYRDRGDSRSKVFQGNWDNETVIKKVFSHRIFARYIRFNPLAWNEGGYICMRVEIYECLPTKGKDRFLDTTC